MIAKLVLFGASGDLAGRYLLPALAALRASGRLPDALAIVGSASSRWDDRTFRRHVSERLAEHAADVAPAHRDALTRSLRYRPADLSDPHDVAAVMRSAGAGAVAAYLAVPPRLFGDTITALAAAGLPAGSRIAVEKPFGESLDDALALNRIIERTVGEEAVFRVDHVLGMATVENLVALRRLDPVLAACWSAEHVERVEVQWEEDLALEGRAGYYDHAGALQDVVQNHMLQLLSVLAMEPPAAERDLRDAKVAALRAARPPRPERTRRARYAAGRIGDRAVPAYVDEEGVDPARGTETFAELVLELQTPRWRGTSFVLRAGKALGARRKQAVVRFRASADDGARSFLRVGVDDPYDIVLELHGLAPTTLTGPPPATDLPPYGRVLLDLLTGGSDLSVRADEAEAAWRLMDPVLAAWRDGRVPLEEYRAGSDGPPRLPG